MKAEGDLRIGHSLECPHCGGTMRKKLVGLHKLVMREVMAMPGTTPIGIAVSLKANDPKTLQSIRDALKRLRENGLVSSEKIRIGSEFHARYKVTEKGRQKEARERRKLG